MAFRPQRVEVARVKLWGKNVGAVAWDSKRLVARFEYERSFLQAGLAISPIIMPLGSGIFSFPELNYDTFLGLPGLLSDALPDRFGNALIDQWLLRQGRSISDFSPIERLCYMGSRGVGALEFEPALERGKIKSLPLEVSELVSLSHNVLRSRNNLYIAVNKNEKNALNTIIQVGTSAGGARAKAVIAWNPKTNEVRSGQVKAPPGFEYWLLKFDGVADDTLGDPIGFGRVEYAYHLMAAAAGIKMNQCRLLEENERAHFMIKRFDRDQSGEKVHMQSLCAMGHLDYNMPGAYGYEHAFDLIQRLNLGHQAMMEQFRRMVFNLVARNQDDHTKNISFLMDGDGAWFLSPAYDLTWNYNPKGMWTNKHQMQINGKRDGFTKEDLFVVASRYNIKEAAAIIEKVGKAVTRWTDFAESARVERSMTQQIKKTHRLYLA